MGCLVGIALIGVCCWAWLKYKATAAVMVTTPHDEQTKVV